MNLMMKCTRLLALLMPGLWLAVPASADDGDGASGLCIGIPCPDFGHDALQLANYTRPGSVIVFPLFIRNGGDAAACGTGNVLVDGVCLPRTEIQLGATCPTRFTVPGLLPPEDQSQAKFPCFQDVPVRVRFRWVCPGVQDFEHKLICETTGFDVQLTENGKVVFTANNFVLPDTNQVHVPSAPCDKGYLIGWVIDDAGRPIKYDGLIGEAVIRNSGTATAAYRGITIQAYGKTTPGSLIDRVLDPLGSQRLGLPFLGIPVLEPPPPDFVASTSPYRLVTGQVTGDVTFDRPAPAAGPGFGTTSSLILLTLDVRSSNPNFPTFVDLDFWNGFEDRLSTTVEFVCWGEFQLSAYNLTEAFMGTRKGIVQSDEAVKVPILNISDIPGNTTLLGLVETDEIPANGRVARSHIVELYNNGIRYWSTAFFP
jgi:hypothetical protein